MRSSTRTSSSVSPSTSTAAGLKTALTSPGQSTRRRGSDWRRISSNSSMRQTPLPASRPVPSATGPLALVGPSDGRHRDRAHRRRADRPATAPSRATGRSSTPAPSSTTGASTCSRAASATTTGATARAARASSITSRTSSSSRRPTAASTSSSRCSPQRDPDGIYSWEDPRVHRVRSGDGRALRDDLHEPAAARRRTSSGGSASTGSTYADGRFSLEQGSGRVIGPPGEPNKDGIVFNLRDGRVALIHRIYPNMQLAVFDSLEELWDPPAGYWEDAHGRPRPAHDHPAGSRRRSASAPARRRS